MFDKLNKAFGILMNNPVAQAVSLGYDKIRNTMRKQLKIIEILPRLYHIDYPYEQHAAFLQQHIAGNDFQLWNISQYSYQDGLEKTLMTKDEKGQINHLHFAYFANLPLFQLIQAINQIDAFLQLCPTGKVYLHCQDNKLRSAVFLACYVFRTKAEGVCDIGQAIMLVNDRLSISVEEQMSGRESQGYRAQHMLLKNLQNFTLNGEMINKKKLKIMKILVNNTPRLKNQNGETKHIENQQTKILLQLRTGQGLAHQSLHSKAIIEEQSICFKLSKKDVIVSDDFLVIIKFVKGNKAYSVLRSQLNTNFIFNHFARINQQDLDLSAFCETSGLQVFLDLMFEQQPSLSKLAQLKPNMIAKEEKKAEQQKAKQAQNQAIIKEQLKNQLNFTFQDWEDTKQLNQNQLSAKIQRVMQSMNSKEEEQLESSQESEDLDDYLSKLQSQA